MKTLLMALLLIASTAVAQQFEATGVYAQKQTVKVSPSGRRFLAMFTASYCGPCQSWKASEKPKLENNGYVVQEYDMTVTRHKQMWGGRIRSLPTFVVVDWDTGEWIGEPIVGSMSAESFMPMLSKKQQREVQKSAQQTVRAFSRLPVAQTPWGRQDLETYESRHRGCNCPMCQGIRGIIAGYRQNFAQQAPVAPQRVVEHQPAISINFGQEATPYPVIEEMITLLKLTPQDVLADLGCGDGRILIAAVTMSGCRAVGVEIDPKKADQARQNIEKAGLSAKITVITGDVLQFEPKQHGITVITAYLYPDLLEKLSQKIYDVGRAGSPYHRIPGLLMKQYGDVWVFDRK